MTRSDLMTVGAVRTSGRIDAAQRRAYRDDASFDRDRADRRSSVALLDAPSRDVRRRPVRTRPAAGTTDYVRRSPGVSQAPHAPQTGFGWAKGLAVVLITAVSTLGLVGLANLSAGDVPAPAPVSVQSDVVGFDTGR